MESRKRRTARLVLRILLLAMFVGGLVFVSLTIAPRITALVRRPRDFRAYVDAHGGLSVLIFILVQAAQVVISVIPGEVVEIAGGYVFGTALGSLYSVIGIGLGAAAAFLAARLFGYGLVKAFVSPERWRGLRSLVNSPRSEIAVFVLFLLPGIPKDTLVYVGGATPVGAWRFLSISMAARVPGLCAAAYIGANLERREFLPVWIVAGAAAVLFIAVIARRGRIFEALRGLQKKRRLRD